MCICGLTDRQIINIRCDAVKLSPNAYSYSFALRACNYYMKDVWEVMSQEVSSGSGSCCFTSVETYCPRVLWVWIGQFRHAIEPIRTNVSGHRNFDADIVSWCIPISRKYETLWGAVICTSRNTASLGLLRKWVTDVIHWKPHYYGNIELQGRLENTIAVNTSAVTVCREFSGSCSR